MEQLARKWYGVVLRGIVAVFFGILALASPLKALAVLVTVFGVYALIDGVLTIVTGFHRRGEHWGYLLFEGTVDIIIGLIVLFSPAIGMMALLYLIAIWAIVTGGAELAAGFRLRKEVENEWLEVLSGVVSIALGILLIVWPGPGLLTIAYLFGIYALVFGVAQIALGLRLHSTVRTLRPVTPQHV
jgi:uncharacterized membrane protein HdeD (DUF308 family)